MTVKTLKGIRTDEVYQPFFKDVQCLQNQTETKSKAMNRDEVLDNWLDFESEVSRRAVVRRAASAAVTRRLEQVAGLQTNKVKLLQ